MHVRNKAIQEMENLTRICNLRTEREFEDLI
jgi:hypothetical protein